MNIKEPSTKRGIIWIITGVMGYAGWWFDKDITGVILLGTTLAGTLGVALDDKNRD